MHQNFTTPEKVKDIISINIFLGSYTAYFMRNTKGNMQLVVNGHKYSCKRKGKSRMDWECIRQRRFGYTSIKSP